MTRFRLPTLARAAAIAAAIALPAADAAAQTFYPAFQPARTVQREYNFAIADGDGGTQFLFQWHEGLTSASGFRFDGGLIDPDGDGDVLVLLGGTYLRQINNAGTELPLDLLFTVGGNAAVGDAVLLEVPVGISVGRRFPLDGTFALTPFVHPRLALQYCNECGEGGDSDTDLGIGVDIGVDFEISSRMSLRGALLLGSDDTDAIGLGLAWRPSGLRR